MLFDRRSWTVARQLAVAFGLLLLLMTAMAVLGGWALDRTLRDMHGLYKDRTEPLQQLGDIRYLVSRDRLILSDAITKGAPEVTSRRLEEFRENRETASKAWKAYMQTTLTAEEEVLAEATEKAMTPLLDDGLRGVAAALEAGRLDEAKARMEDKVAALNPAFTEAMDRLLALQVQVAAQDFERSEAAGVRAKWALAGLTLIALVCGTAAAWAITRRLLGALGAEPDALAVVAERIAAGDLTTQAGGDTAAPSGSVMASMQRMRAALQQTIAAVRRSVESVATASAQIAQGNQDLSARTEAQASSLQQTAASMDELTSTVRQNADNARQAAEFAGGATEVAGRGGEVVSQVVSTMQEIQAASGRIADIVAVIDGIAFQTNILALNAAVEAARAGEQGRGFAVVAGEVRSLAQRSAASAREIRGLIGSSVEKVQAGGQLVGSAGETMQEIVAQVRRVNELIGAITAASAEQSAGIEQVGEAVTQLDRGTQQNAALVEESAAAAESLRQQADQLTHAIAAFRMA